jgi:hypothetical protein
MRATKVALWPPIEGERISDSDADHQRGESPSSSRFGQTLPKQIKQQASFKKKKAASKFQMHAPKEKRGIYKKEPNVPFR